MMTKQRVLVSAMQYEAKGVLSVEMVSAQGEDLARFSAGGHIDVFFREGLVRQYSLINDPEEKNRAKFGSIFNPLKLMGSIVLLACIVPSIPFLMVIATTLAIIKYVVLKNRNL